PRRFGRSAQYSALMATLKEAFDDDDLRPIIIFQTDGDEAIFLRNPIIVPSIPPNLPPDMQAEAQEAATRMQRTQQDNMREFSLRDVYHAVEKSRATIYTIIPGFRLIGLTPDEQVAQIKTYHETNMSAWSALLSAKARERMSAREED